MQKKSYTVNFGDAVTVFPKKAVKKIIKGDATLEEIRVLAAIMASDTKATEVKLCTQTGLDEEQVAEALCFWRGVGVISCEGSQEKSHDEKSGDEKQAYEKSPSEKSSAEKTAKEKTAEVTPEKESKKLLIQKTSPKYTGIEVSAMLEKDGGKLRDMIDTCQQILGYIFTPGETEKLLNLCDQQGVDAEFAVTLTAYLIDKKPRCKVSYVCDRAYDLLSDGISTLDDLDIYIKDRELYDGIAGKIRTLMGIGGRSFTKKENNYINRWAKELAYDIDIIKYAYEVCCDSNGAPGFAYIDTVLENWYKEGVKTLADAEKAHQSFSTQKSAKSGIIKSFDTNEFFSAALERTYKNMAKKSDK